MTDYVIGYHFAGAALRDGAPLPGARGSLPELDGTVICEKGMYHCSTRATDALTYAPGPNVAIVRVYQNIVTQVDKAAGQRRDTLTDYVDASVPLSEWARWCARRVAHFWEPSSAVLSWLWTGDDIYWSAQEAHEAQSAWAAWSAWSAWSAQAAHEARAVWSARSAWSVWSEQKARAAWAVQAAHEAQEAQAAWAAQEARATRAVHEAQEAQNIALEMRLNEVLGIVSLEQAREEAG